MAVPARVPPTQANLRLSCLARQNKERIQKPREALNDPRCQLLLFFIRAVVIKTKTNLFLQEPLS